MPTLPARRLDAIAGVIAGLGLIQIARTSIVAFVTARPSSLDDAFVCLVYLRHFVTSGRIYYDVDKGALDGFTSFLDLLVKSLAVLVSPADPIRSAWWCVLVLHVATGAAAFVLGALLFVRAGASRIYAAAGGVLLGFAVAANPALAYGSSFLLETPLYALLVLATTGLFLLLPRPSPPLYLGMLVASSCALTLARPEGLPIALLVCSVIFFDDRVASLAARRTAASAFAAFVVAYFAFRISYFGAWAPNSYYAKTSASRENEVRDGVQYVVNYFHSSEGWLLGVFLAGPIACAVRRWKEPALRTRCAWTSALGLVALGTVVWAGGDNYEGGRFLSVPLCLALVSIAVAAAGLLGPPRYAAIAVLAGIAAIELAPFASPAAEVSLFRKVPLAPLGERAFLCDRLVAEDLTRIAAGGTIAQTDYQRLKYFSDGARVLDVTGLNDREIAHRAVATPVVWGKFDVLDTVARAPELIVLGHHVFVQPDPMSEHSLRDVLEDPALSDRYFGYGLAPDFIEPVSRAYVSGSILVCGAYFNFLIRRDYGDAAEKAGARLGT